MSEKYQVYHSLVTTFSKLKTGRKSKFIDSQSFFPQKNHNQFPKVNSASFSNFLLEYVSTVKVYIIQTAMHKLQFKAELHYHFFIIF